MTEFKFEGARGKRVMETSAALVNNEDDAICETKRLKTSGNGEGITNCEDVEACWNMELLKCSICLNIWHDVISVSPCLHSFCDSCFSNWYRNSIQSSGQCKCPECRVPVTSAGPNRSLRAIVEDIFRQHPQFRRSSEEMDAMNKSAMVQSHYIKIGCSNAASGDDSSSSSDSEDEDDSHLVCLQCGPPASIGMFQCNPQTRHLICTSCQSSMPRRDDLNVAQKCFGCHDILCDAYWRSQAVSGRSIGCSGSRRLIPASQWEFLSMPTGAFQKNLIEQDITLRYIGEQRLQIQDIFRDWMRKLDNNEIEQPPLLHVPITSSSPLCNRCADLLAQHLLYHFRASVPKSELPPDAATRQDCWYGYKCRTQWHNEAHARKLNHVCEPKRPART